MATQETIIRTATHDDAEAIAAIYAPYVTDTVITFEEVVPAVAEWRRRIDNVIERGLPFLVADLGGEVAGYAYAGPWRTRPAYRHSVEDSIYLAPHRTGKGLGRALLSALLTGCTEAGVRQVIAVIADAGGGASTGLHRAFGFTEAGRLRAIGRKHGQWIDTVFMQRDLRPEPGDGSGQSAR
jgi:phosphinothricin acetyltransferase